MLGVAIFSLCPFTCAWTLGQAQTQLLGALHRDTLRSRLNLACLLADKGDAAEAERLCRAVVKTRRPPPRRPGP